MTTSLPFWLAVGIAVTLGALAWIAAGVGSRLAYRISAVPLLLIGLGLGFVGVSELMGRPKPADQIWLEGEETSARVLAMRLEKDVAIYLWVLLPNDPTPRAYALPWLRRTAEKLDEAMRKAENEDRRVEIEGAMSKWSLFSDGELPIAIIAPPKPPQKPARGRPREVKPGSDI